MRHHTGWIVRTLPAALLLVAAGSAAAGEFVVKPGSENKVVFVSNAAVESFEGKTSRIEGRIVVDPAAVTDSIFVHFEVDMASLDTGIKMRNQHMRNEHLETDQYPKSSFDGAAVIGPAGTKLESGKPVTLTFEGTFTLHGVSRRIRIPVTATFGEAKKGTQIAFETTFPVGLADYNISRPQFLFLKLADVQQVRVKAVANASP